MVTRRSVMCRISLIALQLCLAGSAAWAETIDVYDNHGGLVAAYHSSYVMYALLFDPVPSKSKNQIDQSVASIIMLLNPKAQKLSDELLAADARELHDAHFDITRCHAQPRTTCP